MKNLSLLIFVFGFSILGFSQDQVNEDVKALFIKMLDGTEEAAEKAIKTYGSEEVIANGMIPFGSDPIITSQKDNCTYFSLESYGDKNEYYICSEGGKITEFDWSE